MNKLSDALLGNILFVHSRERLSFWFLPIIRKYLWPKWIKRSFRIQSDIFLRILPCFIIKKCL